MFTYLHAQLLIEAETSSRGFIAVDDIAITPGLCQGAAVILNSVSNTIFLFFQVLLFSSLSLKDNETSLEFTGCTFENGTCGWKDISLGQSQWARGRNASENYGPTTDHTVGTELGEAGHNARHPH